MAPDVDGSGVPSATHDARPAMSYSPAGRRGLVRIWVQVKKAAIPAIVTGVLGYGSGLILPPTAMYDWLFRQDPNDFAGTWTGSAAGSLATLKLTDAGGRDLEGTLDIGGRVIKLKGNHDSALVMEGAINDTQVLKVGLDRRMGVRFFEDSAFVLLVPATNQEALPFLVCERDTMNITNSRDCKSLGDGLTIFSRKRGDMK